jgi:hypothetical protein
VRGGRCRRRGGPEKKGGERRSLEAASVASASGAEKRRQHLRSSRRQRLRGVAGGGGGFGAPSLASSLRRQERRREGGGVSRFHPDPTGLKVFCWAFPGQNRSTERGPSVLSCLIGPGFYTPKPAQTRVKTPAPNEALVSRIPNWQFCTDGRNKFCG